jgi:hypothetical protein
MTTPNVVSFNEYVRALELQYQQRESKLFRTVRTTTQSALSAFYSYIGSTTLDEKTTRHRPTPIAEIDHLRRRLQITFASRGIPLDPDDEVKMVGEPGSKYFQAIAAAAGRRTDTKILAALAGTAYSGQEGATSVNNYDSGECRLIAGDGTLVTAGSDHSNTTETALTLPKLALCRTLFTNAHVPEEGRYFVTNEYNVGKLLQDTTYGSQEWLTVRDIQNGKVGRLYGFEFVILADDMFTTNATDTGCLECYAWQRDAVICATGAGTYAPELRADQRVDLDMMWQFYGSQYCGATRLKGPGVIEILLDAA